MPQLNDALTLPITDVHEDCKVVVNEDGVCSTDLPCQRKRILASGRVLGPERIVELKLFFKATLNHSVMYCFEVALHIGTGLRSEQNPIAIVLTE